MTQTQEYLLDGAKTILDLCGGTGAWTKPYADAGYDVRVITLPEQDVIDYIPPFKVYGILAAPPCQMFSRARNKYDKTMPKKTALWGWFNMPQRKYDKVDEVMTNEEVGKCRKHNRKLPSISDLTSGNHANQSARRAITPPGFAQAFFEANR